MLNNCDSKLILRAEEILDKNFDSEKDNHTVGAAVRCKNGEIYVGVNIHFNHGACAEVIAIGSAMTAGERNFDCIVAVNKEGILSPCGNCRQMLSNYAPECDVIIAIDKKVKVEELIPYPYVRKNKAASNN